MNRRAADWLVIDLAGGRTLTVRNSVLGTVKLRPSGGECRLEWDRCVVWQQTLRGAEWALLLDGGPARPSAGRLAVSARRTLFDVWHGLQVRGAGGMVVGSWAGARNVYRIPPITWAWDDAKHDDRVLGLDAWRRRPGVTEEGSIAASPACFDTAAWRLPPDAPGSRAGPGGADLGADADRVARTRP